MVRELGSGYEKILGETPRTVSRRPIKWIENYFGATEGAIFQEKRLIKKLAYWV